MVCSVNILFNILNIVFHKHICSVKILSLLLLDTSSIVSNLIHERLCSCSNLSNPSHSLTCWLQLCQLLLKQMLLICSSFSFFISSFSSFLQLSERAEYTSDKTSLSKTFCLSKRLMILLKFFLNGLCYDINHKNHYQTNINA